MSSDACIVTQVHVPDFDVQGSLTASDKLRIVQFGLEHLRAFNPDAFIVLCGHGHRPSNEYYDLVDLMFWDQPCYPLDEHGYVAGMPAQFKSVYRGLAAAQERGYKRVLKTRGDCIVGIPNINAHCAKILNDEQKRLLITQQTGPDRMGDCFMYGDTDLLCRTWHKDNPVFNPDGLQNTAYHFRAALADPITDWSVLLKRTCAFRDVHHLAFTCLRWNYRQLDELSQGMTEKLLDPKFDFTPYHWGRVQNWHHFDADGNMSGSAAWFWSERNFYADSADERPTTTIKKISQKK